MFSAEARVPCHQGRKWSSVKLPIHLMSEAIDDLMTAELDIQRALDNPTLVGEDRKALESLRLALRTAISGVRSVTARMVRENE